MRILTLLILLTCMVCTCAEAPPRDTPQNDSGNQALQTVKELYRAAAANDNETTGRLLGDDVQWVEAEGGPFEDRNPYVGVSKVGAGVFGPIAQTYDNFKVTPERFLVDGNRVLAEGRYTGTHRKTGEALDAQFAHVFTTRGTRIVAYQQYTDTYQWRRLAGTLDRE